MTATTQQPPFQTQLTVSGALTLGANLLAAAEPIEERPAFLAAPLLRLDDAVRELKGAVQYRSQLQTVTPSRQQRLRAEVAVQGAHDAVVSSIKSYVLRLSVIADSVEPEVMRLARALVAPMVAWDARQVRLATPRREIALAA